MWGPKFSSWLIVEALYQDGIREPLQGLASSQRSRTISADQIMAARPGHRPSLRSTGTFVHERTGAKVHARP